MKTLGILGGMGPFASLRFCESLLRLSIDTYGAKKNADFPHFIMSSLPVRDFIDDRSDEERAVAMAERELKLLERAGADLVVLACNTMHIYQDRFRAGLNIPFLSMRDEVMHRVMTGGFKRIGLLGSRTTLHSELYAGPLRELGIDLVLPTEAEEEKLVRCIEELVGRGASSGTRAQLETFIESLRKRGAEAVILGCTELPLVIPERPSIPLYNSLQILAEAACAELYDSSSQCAS